MTGTRQKIMTATNELFRRQGYSATSMKDISSASGATIGSIYHHFPGGKDDLTAEVITSTGRTYRELFDAIAAEAGDPATAVVSFFDGAADLLESSDFLDPCPIGGIAREVASTNERLRQAADAAITSWITAMAGLLRQNSADSETADELGWLFVAAIEGAFIVARTQRSVAPMRAAGRRLHPLVSASVTAAP